MYTLDFAARKKILYVGFARCVTASRITQLSEASYDSSIVQRHSSKSVHIFADHVVTLISNLTFISIFVSNVYKQKLFFTVNMG